MIELQYPNGHKDIMVVIKYPDGTEGYCDYDKKFCSQVKKMQKKYQGKLRFEFVKLPYDMDLEEIHS
jgi:hypothetical protein|tara:strand:+ start:1107 stop:1307 length:201 start_codon:yes stop_codon:yes gene_type:complete